MKKLLASLLVLAMCAPAMAVTFSTADGGNGNLVINYSLASGEGIRGLALTLDVTSGDGQVNGVVDGTDFIVDPFNTFVDYAFSNPGYTIGIGHPFANKLAAGVATLPSNSLSICLGYLDELGGQAAVTGTPGSITVKFNLTTPTTVAVALDTLRGGVVGDGLGATAGLPTSQLLAPPVTETITTPTVAKTTAAPAIGTRVNGGRVETFVASGAVSSAGHALEYQFTWGDGTTSAWGPATQTKTYTYGGAGVVALTGYSYNVTVQARCAADTAVVSAASAPLALTSEAVKSTAPFYAAWAQFGRYPCWAYPRNCRGDADGAKQGSAFAGYSWVSTNDLSVFLAAWKVLEPTKGLGMASVNVTLPTGATVNGICADFNRDQQGSSFAGYARVSTNDLTPFLAAWKDLEPTKGPGVPVCDQANYHYWTGNL